MKKTDSQPLSITRMWNDAHPEDLERLAKWLLDRTPELLRSIKAGWLDFDDQEDLTLDLNKEIARMTGNRGTRTSLEPHPQSCAEPLCGLAEASVSEV